MKGSVGKLLIQKKPDGSNEFAARDRFPANQAREVQITRVTGNVFTLRPVAPLEPGEYLLCTAVPGGTNLNICYGFGVQR
jgi:hypothetical protein